MNLVMQFRKVDEVVDFVGKSNSFFMKNPRYVITRSYSSEEVVVVLCYSA